MGLYPTRVALIALMVVGSVTLWIGSPLFWLWLVGRLQSTQPSMGPYLLMLVGIITTSVTPKGLSALNRTYARVSRTDATIALHLPWHRMRGAEHESRARPVTVLDVVMVVSVLIAGTALLLWFIFVHPSPPGIEPGGFKD